MSKGLWSQRLESEYEKEDAEALRRRKFFRDQPSASAGFVRFFPQLPFLQEMAQLEGDGTLGYFESMALGSDEQ